MSITINGQEYILLWNPFTGTNQYVSAGGSGTYDFGTGFALFTATDGSRWKLYVNPDGSVQTDLVTSPTTAGSPMGPPPFLWITYPT